MCVHPSVLWLTARWRYTDSLSLAQASALGAQEPDVPRGPGGRPAEGGSPAAAEAGGGAAGDGGTGAEGIGWHGVGAKGREAVALEQI